MIGFRSLEAVEMEGTEVLSVLCGILYSSKEDEKKAMERC